MPQCCIKNSEISPRKFGEVEKSLLYLSNQSENKAKSKYNKMEQQQKSQLERANEALVELAPSITTSDRQDAMLTYSEFTVIQYLKGRGKNLDTAMKLLELFRKRIENRDQAIAQEEEATK